MEKYKTLPAVEFEEQITRVEHHWHKTVFQLHFLKQIWDALDVDYQGLQIRILQILISKLQSAISRMEKAERKQRGLEKDKNKGSVSRWKYALWKESIDGVIEDLGNWQKIFDPSWYLIMKVASPIIDQELGSGLLDTSTVSTNARNLRASLKPPSTGDTRRTKFSVFLPNDYHLSSAKREIIPFSTAVLIQPAGLEEKFIIDPMNYDYKVNDVLATTKDICNLAKKLHHADPTVFNLLKCRGVVKHVGTDPKVPTGFDFIFRIPKNMKEPRSLRERLLSPGDKTHSLSERFHLARQLANAVAYIHTYDFVHKNIRPETILLFQDGCSSLGSLFLTGFTTFRMADGKTRRFGDDEWQRNLYRHPNRQGLHPERDYVMQHDIYSLGVCLIEIGLWRSIYRPEFSSEQQSCSGSNSQRPLPSKKNLIDLATAELPPKMGNKYTETVVTCLTCLDEDNKDFGDQDEFTNEDGVLVGVRYIEKVRYPQPRRCSNSMTIPLTRDRSSFDLMRSRYEQEFPSPVVTMVSHTSSLAGFKSDEEAVWCSFDHPSRSSNRLSGMDSLEVGVQRRPHSEQRQHGFSSSRFTCLWHTLDMLPTPFERRDGVARMRPVPTDPNPPCPLAPEEPRYPDTRPKLQNLNNY